MNYVEFELSSPEWSTIKILRPVPSGTDPWGIFASIRETPWGESLPTVDGEIMSHAQYGHVMPLVRQLGLPPEILLRKIPKKYRECTQAKNCIGYQAIACNPCKKMPDCYDPPGIPKEAQAVAVIVAVAWREGRYVVIVTGTEYSS